MQNQFGRLILFFGFVTLGLCRLSSAEPLGGPSMRPLEIPHDPPAPRHVLAERGVSPAMVVSVGPFVSVQVNIDAATAAAIVVADRNVAATEPDLVGAGGMRVRALIELLNKRDNFLTNRIIELQDALEALKASSGTPNSRINGLPDNYHGHDGCLAGTGRQLQGQACNFRISIIVSVGQIFQETFAELSSVGSNFGQPDYRFDRLYLTEQWVDALDSAVPTALGQPGRLGSNLPMVWVRKVTPGFHIGPDLIDDRLGVFLIDLR